MQSNNPPVSGGGFAALFRHRQFSILWGGQILAQLADKIFIVLLVALLDELIQQRELPPELANSMFSTLMIVNTLPAIFLGSAAGIFVDRFPKRQIMAGSNLLRGVMVVLLPFLPKAFWILIVVTFLESVLTQFFAPAELSVLPLVVPPQCLMSAIALFNTTMVGSITIGYALSNPLLHLGEVLMGQRGDVIMVGLLYLAAGVVLSFVAVKENLNGEDQAVQFHPLKLWDDFKSGLKYLQQDRLTGSALVQLTILYSVFAALYVLAINLTEFIKLERQEFSYLLAAAGVGMALGAGLLGQWGDRTHNKPLPLIGFISMAFVLGALTLIPFIGTRFVDLSRSLAFGLSFLLGVGASLIGVPMQTLIQQRTPESMRGKVFGFQNNVVNIALSLPLAIAGPLTDRFGVQAVLLGMSLLVGCGGAWAWQRCREVLQDSI
jgi:predicted MFS family arabinose efflux permease